MRLGQSALELNGKAPLLLDESRNHRRRRTIALLCLAATFVALTAGLAIGLNDDATADAASPAASPADAIDDALSTPEEVVWHAVGYEDGWGAHNYTSQHSCTATMEVIEDEFLSRNINWWVYANDVSEDPDGDDGAYTWLLYNQTEVNAELSLDEGRGLRIWISGEPCNSGVCEMGDMASGHLQTQQHHGFGDYSARLRAPHEFGSRDCSQGIYGYFTAGEASLTTACACLL